MDEDYDEKMDLDNTVSYEQMCHKLGTTTTTPMNMFLPAAKRKKKPAPGMSRLLLPMPYHEPQHYKAREWVGQLPLAMVAQLIPSKQVDSMSEREYLDVTPL